MIKRYLFFTFIFLMSSNIVLLSQNYLSTQGNKLIDSKGNTVRLTGVNWFGFETNLKYPHGLWSRDCKSMLKQIKDLGFNCIRFPYSNDILKSDAKVQLNSYGTDPYTGVSPMNQIESTFTHPLQLMDKIVEYCQQLNLKIILDNHSRKSDNYMNEMLWYTSDISEAKWIADWVTLATRYKNTDVVIGMDLDNEPNGNYGQGCTWGNSSTATDWNKAAERCGNAILQANPNVLIIVEGIQTYNGDGYWWGGNLKGVADYPVTLSKTNKLVYSPHEYGPEVHNQSWFTDSSFPSNMAGIWHTHFDFIYKNNTAPLLCGEFGIRDPNSYSGTEGVWFDTFMTFMGPRYSWTFWCWNPNSGDTEGLLDNQWTNPVQWKINKLKPYMAPEIPNTSNSGNTSPVAKVSASAVSGTPPLTITFDASASSDADGDALTYTWDFGDNTSGTGAKITHIYNAVGSYSATVTVSDGKGGSATASIIVTVTSGSTIPVTSVSVNPSTATIAPAGTIQLNAIISPSNATNVNVSWSSDNTAIATVNATGLVTGSTEGTAVITVTTEDGGKTATCVVSVSNSTQPCTFGTPLATALPTVNKSYNYVYVLGTGGPSLSNVSTFTINWDLPNKGLYQFSMNTKDGKPNWYVDLRTGAIQSLASAQPSIALAGTGFTGLDGSYYVTLNSSDFVMVSTNKAYTIYFSNSTTAPACTKSAKAISMRPVNDILLYPNPFNDFMHLYLTDPGSILDIKVIDRLGRTISIPKEQISTVMTFGDRLSKGMYFVKIVSTNGIRIFTISKN